MVIVRPLLKRKRRLLKKIIKEVYSTGQGVDLIALSTYLNRPKTSISKIAHEMGLSHYGNYTNKKSRTVVNV